MGGGGGGMRGNFFLHNFFFEPKTLQDTIFFFATISLHDFFFLW